MSHDRLIEMFDAFIVDDENTKGFALRRFEQSDATDRFISQVAAELGDQVSAIFGDFLADPTLYILKLDSDNSVEHLRVTSWRARLGYVVAYWVCRQPTEHSAARIIDRLTRMFENGFAGGDKNNLPIGTEKYDCPDVLFFHDTYHYPRQNDCLDLLLEHSHLPTARDFLRRVFTGEFFQTHRIEETKHEFNNYESMCFDVNTAALWLQEMHASDGFDVEFIAGLSEYFPHLLKVDYGMSDDYKKTINQLKKKVLADGSTNVEISRHLNSDEDSHGIERLKLGLTRVRDEKIRATELRSDKPHAEFVRELLRLEELQQTESQKDLLAMLANFDKKSLKVALHYSGIAKDQVLRSLGMESLLALDQLIRQAWEDEGDDPIYNCDDPSNGVIDLEQIRHITRNVPSKMLATYLSDYAKAFYGPKRMIALIQAAFGIDREKTEKKLARHDQSAIKAYGLYPVLNSEELQRRYLHLKKMHKQATQYGMERQANTRAAVAAGLSNLAQSAGFTDVTRMEWTLESDLTEQTVAFNEWQDAAGWQICLRLEGTRTRIVARKGDKELKSTPTKVRQQSNYKSLRTAQDQVNAQTSLFRNTLQAMMCQGELVSPDELATLRRLPVVAAMLSQLILRDEKGQFGLLNPAGDSLTSVTGESIAFSGSLQIAHTFHLFESDVLSKWQQAIVTRQITQPFKQAFRELYIVTPAEIETRVCSRRFYGHVVKPTVASKLLQSRGWSLGNWEFPQSQRIFARHDTVASIEFEGLGHYFAEHTEICMLNVEFRRNDQAIDVNMVDPLVFSETMRDADLVVGVAQKTDGDTPWSQELVEHRRQILSALVETMGLTGVTVERRHVLVTGTLATYQVHLGSGNIHIVPGNYLCIVSGREKDDTVYLPFADSDARITEIVSKVLLLSNDDKIKDQSILSQIHRKRPQTETT